MIPSDIFMIFMFHIQVVLQLAVIGQHCWCSYCILREDIMWSSQNTGTQIVWTICRWILLNWGWNNAIKRCAS